LGDAGLDLNITEITPDGNVTIAFSQPILLPKDVPHFIPSDKICEVNIKRWDATTQKYMSDLSYFTKSDDTLLEDDLASFKLTNLNSTHCTLKLNFTEQVSIDPVLPDQLFFRLKSTYVFVSDQQKTPVR